ncbi:MAG TPA: hypothetical protein VEK09_01575 [Jatrophihabitantaceae bacterium]|nr:hypothetical protein [Jatrophihabitantaceae bacterium]
MSTTPPKERILQRGLIISAVALAAVGLAAAPAVAGLAGNPSFSHQLPVHVPSQARAPQLVDDHGRDDARPSKSSEPEPGDDRGGASSEPEPGDDRGGATSSESEPGDDRGSGSGHHSGSDG